MISVFYNAAPFGVLQVTAGHQAGIGCMLEELARALESFWERAFQQALDITDKHRPLSANHSAMDILSGNRDPALPHYARD